MAERRADFLIEPRMRLSGACIEHGDIDAQGQQGLSEFVVDLASDALAFFFLHAILVRGEVAQ
ncbi:hypothetical protein D9M68_883520 [compost metagenome]